MRKLFRPVPLAVAAVLALIVFALSGFLLVPYIIKSYVLPLVSEELQRPVLVRDVEFNPFQLALRLTGFEIQEKDQTPLIGFEELFVNFRLVSIVRQAYVFDTIRFSVPYVSVKVGKDGSVNLAGLVPSEESSGPPPETASQSKGEIPAVQIGTFEIAQGIVEFRDESKRTPFSLDIVPINLRLNNFHTKPGGDNTYSFTAELGQEESLAWEGTISLEPIRSQGKLALTGVKIPTLFQYVKDQFRFDLPSGTLQAKGQYRFDATASPVELEVSDTSVHLGDLTLAEKGDPAPVISVPALDVDGIEVSMAKKHVTIQSVHAADGKDRVWRNQDGSINLQTLFAPADNEPAGKSASTPAAQPGSAADAGQPWTVSVKDVRVTNRGIQFEDRSLSLPMKAEVTAMSLKTHDLAVPIKDPIPVQIDLTLNETGTVSVDGQVIVQPLQLDMNLALKNIAIQPFQPYLEQFAHVAVDGGSVDLGGKVHFAAAHPKAPLMTFGGNLGVKSLALADQERGEPLLSWKQLQLRQVSLAVDPTTVAIEEIGIEQPTIHVGILPDGRTNLSTLAVKSDAQPSSGKPEPAVKKSSAPSVSVKTVKLLKGTATFADESITPNVRMGLYDLTGTVKGLSSKQLAKADVDLSGTVDKVAPLKVTGAINPLSEQAFTDLAVKFDNVDLTAVAPYSGKYAGYPIRKGKLFLDLGYKVSQKILEAENKVRVDQLTFGEKTDSPDATSLPVPFAVALLKDRDGRIDIDLPIRGDLNDPDFKYGRVLLSTLVNLLGKLVASPFGLMGKLIPGGGSGEDLQFIEFDPGSAALAPSEAKKVEALTKGLEERPGLRLEITGAADPAHDRTALSLRKLKAQLLAKWHQGKPASGETDLLAIEEERLLRELYDQRPNRPPTPQTQAGVAKPPSLDEIRRELAAAIPVDDDALRTLARERADQVRGHFTGSGKLSDERIFLTEVEVAPAGQERVRSRLNITAGSS